MRPLRITIQGLRSFRSEVGIDFGDRTQIAVIGDTGAGKSSILEAMTYALYGLTSVGGRSKQELMNDTSDVMRVVLRFQVAGEEWEVTRVDRRAGAGGLRPPQAQLVRFAPDGETIEKVEQVRLVNDRVKALIGLNSDAFLRTVILPQGRFARLLVEDAPSARTEILRQVWRTHDLEAAGGVAEQRLSEVRTLAAQLRDEVQRHPDDPEAFLEDLASRTDAASHKALALASLRDRSKEVRDALRRSEAAITAARRASEKVTPSVLDELAGRLAPMEIAQSKIEAKATKLKERKANLKQDLHAIPADDGPDRQQVARTLTMLEAIPNEVVKAGDAARALRRAIAAEAEAAKHHAQMEQTLESARDQMTGHEALGPPLEEAVAAARKVVEKAERAYEKCDDLRERIGSAEDALAGWEQEMADVIERLSTAQRDRQTAQRRLRRAEREMSEAQRTNAAAAAARDLGPGDECPVCRQELSEGWSPPQDPDQDAVGAALEAAKSQTNEARQAVAEGEAQQKSGQQRIDDIKGGLDALRSEIASALAHLRSAAGLDDAFPLSEDQPLSDREQILGPVLHRLRESEAKRSDHDAKAEVLREAQTSAQMEENSARKTVEHMQKDIDRNRNDAGEALRALHLNIQSVPSPFRPDLVLPSDPMDLEAVDTTPVDRSVHSAREREEVLRLREENRARLRSEIDDTRAALERLEATRGTEVEEPLQALVRELAHHRTDLEGAVRELSADIAIPTANSYVSIPTVIHYPVDAETLREGIERLHEAMVEVVALADDLRRRSIAAADEARSEACKVAEQLDPPVDATDLEALVESTREAAREADFTVRAATKEQGEFATILEDLLTLRQTAEEVTALERALGDLDAALKPGAFLKWLTLRRSRDLLVYASRMLEEMTGDRYSFADPGNVEDQQWLVVDNDSGQARSPASLSGGEQFIGSLALALGMVEMMARSGGRLESLFLDEGFGSLDRSSLDSAIEALSIVAGTGRMVGVISHVRAVAEQIDDVLAVRRGTTGSQVTWLSHAQRQELALPDAGPEGASALAGLLE